MTFDIKPETDVPGRFRIEDAAGEFVGNIDEDGASGWAVHLTDKSSAPAEVLQTLEQQSFATPESALEALEQAFGLV